MLIQCLDSEFVFFPVCLLLLSNSFFHCFEMSFPSTMSHYPELEEAFGRSSHPAVTVPFAGAEVSE